MADRKPQDDYSRKSLELLMNNLKKVKSEAEARQKEQMGASRASTRKQSSSKAVLSPSERKRRKIANEGYPKITPWINKDKLKENKGAQSRVKAEPKPKPLDVTVKPKRKQSKLERNSSFEKYGGEASFEKILADHKKFEEHKNKVKVFDSFDYKVVEETIGIEDLEVKRFEGELLDCKHLSLGEVKEIASKYIGAMNEIRQGRKYSKRHQNYKNSVQYNFTAKDLRCSTECFVFSQEQKDLLLKILSDAFDPEDKMTGYFFKVLLPELCLLIFMDVHEMSKTQATKYLAERPID